MHELSVAEFHTSREGLKTGILLVVFENGGLEKTRTSDLFRVKEASIIIHQFHVV